MQTPVEQRDPRSHLVHRAMSFLVLVGALASGMATVVHYTQSNPQPLDLVIPPILCAAFVAQFFYLHFFPARFVQVAWANYLAGLIGVAIPAWYYPLWAQFGGGPRLIESLPPISAAMLPLMLMLAVFAKPRHVITAVVASWVLVSAPILFYLIANPDEIRTPRGHDLAMTLGPVMLLFAIYVSFHRELERIVASLRVQHEELRALAERDALTGLFNRRAGQGYLERMLAGRDRSLGLILFDIDRFKRINDTFGHPAGDAVLRTVAARCQTVLRKDDVFARWGGEEFLVLVPVSDLDGAARVAEHLRQAICAEPVDPVGTVTSSFGVTLLARADTQETALQRADEALYRAKEGGRDQVVAA